MLAYGAVQIYAGYVGIEDAYSKGWAIAALIGAFALRFMLPLTWGAFLCARDIWDWHWAWAVLFAAPGLAFMLLMIPGWLGQLVQIIRGR